MAVTNGLHRNSTGANVHVPFAWVYADSTARLAATGFVPADVTKAAWQVSDATAWILTDDSPITWAQMGGSPYTDEMAQDAIGAMLVDTATVDLTYIDATPALKADVIPGGIKLDDLGTPDDNIDLDVSTTRHGLTPKLPNDATKYLNGVGGYTVPAGGGGGLTVQYPALKPATPTYDFAGASLDVAFSAHSSQGSFATTDCLTQSPLGWPGSTLAMHFSGQMGGLYVAHGDTDFDFTVGGIQRQSGLTDGGAVMIGIAALDSSGNGVGPLLYSDTHAYLSTITAWNYVTGTQKASFGIPLGNMVSGPVWLRLKRISGTWTAYISHSGRVWDYTWPTRADSVTVDRLFFGLLLSTSTAYSGILTADYFHVAV